MQVMSWDICFFNISVIFQHLVSFVILTPEIKMMIVPARQLLFWYKHISHSWRKRSFGRAEHPSSFRLHTWYQTVPTRQHYQRLTYTAIHLWQDLCCLSSIAGCHHQLAWSIPDNFWLKTENRSQEMAFMSPYCLFIYSSPHPLQISVSSICVEHMS